MTKLTAGLSLFTFIMLVMFFASIPNAYRADHPLALSLPSFATSFKKIEAQNRVILENADPKSKRLEFTENVKMQLKKQPLSASPLIQSYALEKSAEDIPSTRAFALLEMAYSRNRRNDRNTSLLLLEYVNRADLDRALPLIVNLIDTNSPSSENYKIALEALIAMAPIAEAEQVIKDEIENSPPWNFSFFEGLAKDPTQNTSEKYGRFLVSGRKDERLNAFQQGYMLRLIRQAKFESAYAHWTALLDQPSKMTNIFNETFESVNALPPFNWTYRNRGPNTFETLGVGGGLFIRTDNQGFITALQQVTRLEPGKSYHFNVEGYGQTRFNRQTSYWRMQCLNSTQDIVFSTDQRDSSDFPKGTIESEDFDIPIGCPYQNLEFVIKAPGGKRFGSISLNRVYIEDHQR